MTKELLNYFKGDDLAASVWEGKYKQEGEKTPDDMHIRLAKEFAKVEEDYIKQELYNHPIEDSRLSKYGSKREKLTENRIYEFFKDFKYIVPQGSIMANLGAKEITSLSNCFVIGNPEDSYGGIFQKDEEMAQLMKRRGGVGLDISTLRPEGASTSNAAKSSTGAVSFMHRFSNTTREVAQNGRRGALMLSISINHPDVMEFIKIKRDLSQVTGANISIKLNNRFMEAVDNEEDYFLTFPTNEDKFFVPNEELEYNKIYKSQKGAKFVKRIDAKHYWEELIKSAHNVAEPGLMFEDNHIDYSPDGVYDEFRGVTTNPCGEIFMQPYDACRLIAINLYSFVDNPFSESAEFNFEKFYKINYEAMRLSDDLIDLELGHIQRILDKIDNDSEKTEVKRTERELWVKVYKTAQASRRTGLGFTALGDTLAALNLKYDSDKSLNIIENIMDAKMASELDCSIDLAILRGTFEGWSKDKEYKFHYNGIDGETGLAPFKGGNSFYNKIGLKFPDQVERMSKYGRRNVSFSTVAPTGTVSLMTQTTSGLEPLFMAFYMRRKKVNPNDENVRVDFTDQNGDTWQEYPVLHPKFQEWLKVYIEGNDFNWDNKGDLQKAFEKSPWHGATANDIDWIKRVEIQGIIQKYITHSISSTINLPEDVKEKEVSEIYMESWKRGLKGITVYRDGARSGVLVDNNKEKNDAFNQNNAPKRPKKLPCNVHKSSSKGKDWLIMVGLLDSKPYEVFCVKNNQNLSGYIYEGVLTKIKKGEYTLDVPNQFNIEKVTSEMTDEQEAVTRLISTSLRHGADIKFLVEQLSKTGGDMFTFTKSLARVLKKYIKDGEKSTMSCQDCGSDNVIFQEGCMSCQDCGSSKCG